MKRNIITFISITLVLLLAACGQKPAEVVNEYEDIDKLGSEFIHSGVEAYEIGADKNGMPVFKDPDAALEQAKEDFAEGFKQLENEFDLKPVSKDNWDGYKIYGWQTTSEDADIAKQCMEITSFFDIYENSYK